MAGAPPTRAAVGLKGLLVCKGLIPDSHRACGLCVINPLTLIHPSPSPPTPAAAVSTTSKSWAVPPSSDLLCEEGARNIDQVILVPQEGRRRTRPGQTLRRFDAGW